MTNLAAAKKQENSTVEAKKTQTDEPQFSKEQIFASARYGNCRDLVDALLNDKEKYTFEMVDKLIEKYKKGQVK